MWLRTLRGPLYLIANNEDALFSPPNILTHYKHMYTQISTFRCICILCIYRNSYVCNLQIRIYIYSRMFSILSLSLLLTLSVHFCLPSVWFPTFPLFQKIEYLVCSVYLSFYLSFYFQGSKQPTISFYININLSFSLSIHPSIYIST